MRWALPLLIWMVTCGVAHEAGGMSAYWWAIFGLVMGTIARAIYEALR